MTAAEIVATVAVRRAVLPLGKPGVPVGPEVEPEGLVVVRREVQAELAIVHVLLAKAATGLVAVTAGRIGVRKVFVRRRPSRCLKCS